MFYRQEYDRKIIGHNLRLLRERCNYSVEDVRRYLRLGSVQAIYKWEEGKCYPQADTLLALMDLYSASVKDIVTTAYYDMSDYIMKPVGLRREMKDSIIRIWNYCLLLQKYHAAG